MNKEEKGIPMTIEEFKIAYDSGTLSFNALIELAKNIHTTAAILTKLSQDKELGIRCAAIANSNMPQEILTKLSQDKEVNIRCSIASNLNTPQEVLTTLSTDKDAPVRYNVLVNSKTSTDTCATIRDFDKCSVIVYIAAKQCNTTLYEYTNKG